MSPLQWKVYRGAEYFGATRYAEDAAALVSLAGPGATVKCSGAIVWREGSEVASAAESYDDAADLMRERRTARITARRFTP